MVRLHQEKDFLKSKNVNLVVIVPENEAGLTKYLNNTSINLNFVSDSKHTIADKYHQAVKFLKLGRMPAQILLDKDLNVVYEHHASNMKDVVLESEIFKDF